MMGMLGAGREWNILQASQGDKAPHLLSILDIIGKRRDVQRKTKPPPGLQVVNIFAVDAVELMDQRSLEIFMGVLPFGIVAVPAEEITHPVELLAGRLIAMIGELVVLGKEFVERICREMVGRPRFPFALLLPLLRVLLSLRLFAVIDHSLYMERRERCMLAHILRESCTRAFFVGELATVAKSARSRSCELITGWFHFGEIHVR